MRQEPLYISYVALKNRLKQIAKRFLGNDDDASDAVQEAFCRLWTVKERIVNEEQARAWAIRTTQHICIDKLRHDRSVTFDRIEEHVLHPVTTTVQDDMENKELFCLIRRIVEQHLSEQQKIIFRMKDIEGYEIEQIAKHLDMHPATVRVNLSRARKEIRIQYQKITGHEK